MTGSPDVQVVRLHRFEGDSKTRAFADISIGQFVVKGLRVVEGKKGMFLAMPQEKAKDGKWYDTFFPATKEAREFLNELVLSAYQQ
ncbi:MAG: SpoVG family protein [Candidatus Omnitrophica bacterium]|nr:SpoVG family protein [Candidatus Omnitrophota bacterium]MDD5775264.1 SpoVG family protein [Candidatus Omnitrophota bacterium]HNQ50676.1 SpoVG family protein [Candidatus Omnitrophota bacterium]HQO37461.1 SpoVG family protein [Candidatus Omnitrophota bacterium]HQQ05662.1 SpoVG family protein [Candidatus Omnitrophota bacterium]